MKPAGLTRLFGFETHGALATEEDVERLLGREAGRDGLLELAGVDGLIIPRQARPFLPALRADGWEPAADTEGACVLHRDGAASPRVRVIAEAEWSRDRQDVLRRLKGRGPGPLPMLLDASDLTELPSLVLGRADVTLAAQTRNSLTVEVRNGSPDRPVLVALSEPWYPGYAAHFNGRPVPVRALDLAVPAVLLPPGADGQLVLNYWPTSFVRGCQIAGATLAGVLILMGVGLMRAIARRRLKRAP
jgi:hypothetical protein